MGLRSLFKKRPERAGVTPEAGGPVALELLTSEQLVELEAAWAELTAAAEASEITDFHACTRNGRPWTEDPAAVRAAAATLREFPALEDQPSR